MQDRTPRNPARTLTHPTYERVKKHKVPTDTQFGLYRFTKEPIFGVFSCLFPVIRGRGPYDVFTGDPPPMKRSKPSLHHPLRQKRLAKVLSPSYGIGGMRRCPDKEAQCPRQEINELKTAL